MFAFFEVEVEPPQKTLFTCARDSPAWGYFSSIRALPSIWASPRGAHVWSFVFLVILSYLCLYLSCLSSLNAYSSLFWWQCWPEVVVCVWTVMGYIVWTDMGYGTSEFKIPSTVGHILGVSFEQKEAFASRRKLWWFYIHLNPSVGMIHFSWGQQKWANLPLYIGFQFPIKGMSRKDFSLEETRIHAVQNPLISLLLPKRYF